MRSVIKLHSWCFASQRVQSFSPLALNQLLVCPIPMPAVGIKVCGLQAGYFQSRLKQDAVIPILKDGRSKHERSATLLERQRLICLLLVKYEQQFLSGLCL